MEKKSKEFRRGGIPHQIQRKELPPYRVADRRRNQRTGKKHEEQDQPLQQGPQPAPRRRQLRRRGHRGRNLLRPQLPRGRQDHQQHRNVPSHPPEKGNHSITQANEIKGKWSESLMLVCSKLLNFTKNNIHYGVLFS